MGGEYNEIHSIGYNVSRYLVADNAVVGSTIVVPDL